MSVFQKLMMTDIKKEETSTTFPLEIPKVSYDNNAIDYSMYGESSQNFITIDNVQYKLPENFTVLDYIESTGTQYIDTGLLHTDLIVEYTACTTDSSATSQIFLATSTSANWVGWKNGNPACDTTMSSIDATQFRDYKVTYTSSNISLEDIATGTTNTTANGSLTNNLRYFAWDTSYPSKTKLKHIKFSNSSGTVLQNLIPMKRNSDSVLGMYDFVTNTFYTNAGTGSFTAGNESPNPDQPLDVVSVGDKTIVYTPSGIYKEGSPTITSAGIYTTNASTSFIRTEDTVPFSTASTWSFKWKFTYATSSSDQGIMSGSGSTNVQAIINNTGKPRMSFGNGSSWFTDGIWNETAGSGTTVVSFNYVAGTTYSNEIKFTGTRYEYWVDGVLIGYCTCSSKASDTYFAVGVERQRTSGQYTKCSWDLKETSLTLDGTEYLLWNVTKYQIPIVTGSNCGCVDLGSFTWTQMSTLSGHQNHFQISISDIITGLSTSQIYITSDTYSTITGIGRYNLSANKLCQNSNGGVSSTAIVLETLLSSASDVKQSLSGVYLYYQRTIDTSWTAPTITTAYLSEPLRKVGSSYADYIYWGAGKNLFDKSAVSFYTLLNTSTGAEVAQEEQYSWASGWIKVEPSTTYYFKSGANYNVRIFEYDSSKTYLSTNYTVLNNSFTVGSNCGYIRFHIGATAGGQEMYEGETMLVEGSTAPTTYQPYSLTPKVVRNVGYYECTGAETWSARAEATRNYCYFTLSGINTNTIKELYCTHFGISNINTPEQNKMCVRLNKNGFLFTSNTLCTDTTTWKSWLASQYSAGTPVTVTYPLATPTTETLTDLPAIPLVAGTDEITVNTTVLPSAINVKAWQWRF